MLCGNTLLCLTNKVSFMLGILIASKKSTFVYVFEATGL